MNTLGSDGEAVHSTFMGEHHYHHQLVARTNNSQWTEYIRSGRGKHQYITRIVSCMSQHVSDCIQANLTIVHYK